MSRRVLMVEDDALFVDVVGDLLEPHDVVLTGAATLASARARLDEDWDLVILDQHLPDGSGLDLAPALREHTPHVPVLLVTASPDVRSAVRALREGIVDYLVKPVDTEAFRETILGLLLDRGEPLTDAEAPAGVGVEAFVERAGHSRAPVLLLGETGTGKTRLARQVHERGGAARPFQLLNCAAIPPELIESELFGTDAGAFTGARSRAGLVESADGGTLFLDEIGDLSVASQAKLLHVLESGEVRRVGGVAPRSVSVRFIAATHRDLDREVEAGRFREDLLYRLDVLRLELAPLRERTDELGAICEAMLRELSPSATFALEDSELRALAAHPWPGNLRELRNVLERALVFGAPSSLAPAAQLRRPALRRDPEAASLEAVARAHILTTLRRCQGQREQTAKELGIGVATLRRKLHQYRDEGFADQIERIDRSI